MRNRGQFREQIVVQSATNSVAAGGQVEKTFATFVTIWARAEYLTGRELEGMQKIVSSIALKFTVNFRLDITPLMRVSWRSTTWNIEALLPAENKVNMMLLCSKVE